MVNVGVVTSKATVANNMETIIVKSMARYKLINPYSFEAIQDCSIVIFDLDNLDQTQEKIENTILDIPDQIRVGYSRSRDILKEYESLFNTRQKPFLKDHFTSYLDQLKKKCHEDRVVNTEKQNEHDKGNLNFQDLLSSDVFSNKELSAKLSKLVNEKYKGPSTDQLMKKIGLDDMEPVQMRVEVKPPVKMVINYNSQFVDDALIRYRTQKLKKLRLSVDEITNKISSMIELDVRRAANKKSFIQPDDIINSISKSHIYDDLLEDQQRTEEPKEIAVFEEPDINIGDQRKEAIDRVAPPILVDSDDESDKFTDTELKYIKREQPKNIQQVVPDKGKLDKKLQSVLSKEQIEKLRKLGAKI